MKKLSALLLTALSAGSTSATSGSDFADVAAQLPECSLECIQAGAEKFDCQVVDFACQCAKMEEINAEVSPCMVKAGCGMEDITNVATIVAGLCAGETGDSLSVADESESDDEADADETDGDETDGASSLRDASLLSALVFAAFAVAL